jgi:hypothetical protein
MTGQVSILQLYKFAAPSDILLLFIGTLAGLYGTPNVIYVKSMATHLIHN